MRPVCNSIPRCHNKISGLRPEHCHILSPLKLHQTTNTGYLSKTHHQFYSKQVVPCETSGTHPSNRLISQQRVFVDTSRTVCFRQLLELPSRRMPIVRPRWLFHASIDNNATSHRQNNLPAGDPESLWHAEVAVHGK